MDPDATGRAGELRAANQRVLADLRASHRVGRPPADQQVLVADLAAVGVRVRTIWDLVNDSTPYPLAVPVLMSWLEHIDELPADDKREQLREGLIRALSVKEARPVAAPLLVSQFRLVADPMLRWTVGNALAQAADHTVFADIADLITDRGYGAARQMMVQALGRIGGRRCRPQVVELLVGLLDDDDVVLHALHAVGTLKITAAIPKLDQLSTNHPVSSVRRAAQKVLLKLRQ